VIRWRKQCSLQKLRLCSVRERASICAENITILSSREAALTQQLAAVNQQLAGAQEELREAATELRVLQQAAAAKHVSRVEGKG
jgi:hypothetical protein